jgi:3-isopropylmalate dehydratase small subunit
MGMTLLEKILSSHSGKDQAAPGDIVVVTIDARVARDFGGANVVKNLRDFNLPLEDPSKTLFTFDCNPTGSDQKYAVNQHLCRIYAREQGVRVSDIDAGIGTHLLIDQGLVYPGATAVSTDSHANILGAVGAFGQGMGDMDIAAAWHSGKVWFKVPHSVRIIFEGAIPKNVGAKDIVLNLLGIFGANSLLGYSIEICGAAAESLGLDERITISSMATEMGAVIILFSPSDKILKYCSERTGRDIQPVFADKDAAYFKTFSVDVTQFVPMAARPGEPHDTVPVTELTGIPVDSAFIGSCTNGRMSDMRKAAEILKDRKIAPGVVLKIVPATDEIWNNCLSEGLIGIFKNAGAMVSNAGCAGCAAGQVGQNGPGEVTISTGNRNFPGKQGKGSVYLASPEVVAASAIAGRITLPGATLTVSAPVVKEKTAAAEKAGQPGTAAPGTAEKPTVLEGKIWCIDRDNIDTDMIFHNRYLAITDLKEMGQYTFDNLKGFEDFARKASRGDIVIAGKNFGSGSSRQQAVDCFVSLGIQAVVAESFGVIYERNAINAAFPVVCANDLDKTDLESGDLVRIDLKTGELFNHRSGLTQQLTPFSAVQLEIYQRGGLLVRGAVNG